MAYIRLLFFTVICGLFCSCRETLFHNLSEQEVNRMRVLLQEQKINAYKSREGDWWSLEVGNVDVVSALAVLNQSKLLRSEPKVAELSESLVPTREERERRVERELENRLGETMSRLQNVSDARVHLRLRQESVAGQNKQSGTASVLLITTGRVEVDAIRQLVSGATGIDNSDVQVLMFDNRAPDNPLPETISNNTEAVKSSDVRDRQKGSPTEIVEAVFALISFVIIAIYYYLNRKNSQKSTSLLRPRSDKESNNDSNNYSEDNTESHVSNVI